MKRKYLMTVSNGFKPRTRGIAEIVGGGKPYIWLGEGTRCIGWIDRPSMDSLAKAWLALSVKRNGE